MAGNHFDQYDDVPPATGPRKRNEDEVIQELGTKMPYVEGDGGNYFDQYDEPEAPPEQQKDVPLWQVPWEAGTNWPQDATEVLKGVADSIAPWNWARTLGDMTNMIGGAPMLALGADAQEAITHDNPQTKAMLDAAQGVIEGYQETYKDGPFNALARNPAHVMLDAATLAQPFAGAGRTALNSLGVPGRAIDAAAIAVNPSRVIEGPAQFGGHVARAGAKRLDAGGNLLLDSFEGQEGAVLAKIQAEKALRAAGSPDRVPNFPTTGVQAAVGMTEPPTRGFKLAHNAEDLTRTPIENIKNRQGKALLADIGNIGSTSTITPAQRAIAGGVDPTTASIVDLETGLKAADAHNYGISDPIMSTADDRLYEILSLPHNSDVLAEAAALAAQKELPFGSGTYVPAVPATPPTSVPSGLVDASGRPIMRTVPGTPAQPAQYPKYSGKDLHFIKLAFDGIAFKKNKDGLDKAVIQGVRDAREKFLNWTEDPSRNPAYKTSREDSQAWRKQIDRRTAMEMFRDTLNSPLTDDGNQAAQRLAMFQNLFDSPRNVTQGNKALKKATDFDAYDQWSDLLTPEDMNILKRNRAELQRVKEADELGKKKTVHAGEIHAAQGAVQAPGLMKTGATVFNSLMRAVQGGVNAKTGRKVANSLLTPDGTIDALTKAVNNRTRLDHASIPAHLIGRAIQGANRVPAGYNALQYSRDEQEMLNRPLR